MGDTHDVEEDTTGFDAATDEYADEEFYDPNDEAGKLLVNEAMSASDLTRLSELYDQSRAEKKVAEQILKAAARRESQIEERFWNEMLEANQDNIKRSDGVVFSRAERIYPKVADAQLLVKSFTEEGTLDVMTKVEFRKDRLGEVIRTSLKKGVALPDGLGFSAVRYISRRQQKANTRYTQGKGEDNGSGEAAFEIGK